MGFYLRIKLKEKLLPTNILANIYKLYTRN